MSPEVLAASGSGMRSFVDTTLMEDFGKCIELIRKTFFSQTGWRECLCCHMLHGPS